MGTTCGLPPHTPWGGRSVDGRFNQSHNRLRQGGVARRPLRETLLSSGPRMSGMRSPPSAERRDLMVSAARADANGGPWTRNHRCAACEPACISFRRRRACRAGTEDPLPRGVAARPTGSTPPGTTFPDPPARAKVERVRGKRSSHSLSPGCLLDGSPEMYSWGYGSPTASVWASHCVVKVVRKKYVPHQVWVLTR